MAYISADEVRVIRNNLKKAFPEVKFSVRNENHSWVHVTILESPYDFELNGKDHREVNQHWFETDNVVTNHAGENILPHSHQDKLRKMIDIIAKEHWDESDSMTDYFHCAFYYSLKIGDWNKPYKMVEKKKPVAKAKKKSAPKKVSESTKAKKVEAEDSFVKARMNMSEENDNIVISAFENRGIEATPREDVFTFNIWKHKFDRIVKKGEKGVKIGTYFKTKKLDENGDEKIKTGRKMVTVFHISQTEKL